MTKGGIRLVHGRTKKHPKHVFLILKFASLNKYSSGIWHPKQVFFFSKNPKKKKKKKKTQVILSALCPLLCKSTRPQHTLQMFADHCGPRQTIPWETINQGLLQPQGELYPIQTIFNHRSRDQLLEFRTSFYETISSEFLVQGNFKHTQFSLEHWSLTGLELATSRTQSNDAIILPLNKYNLVHLSNTTVLKNITKLGKTTLSM